MSTKGRKSVDFCGVFAVHDQRKMRKKQKEWKIHSPQQLWRRMRKFWDAPDCSVSINVTVDVFLKTDEENEA